MSIQSVHDFIDRVKADAALRTQVMQTLHQPDAVVALAQGRGFGFTLEEGQAVLKEMLEGELPDDLLEMAAGGAGGSCTTPTDTNSFTAKSV